MMELTLQAEAGVCSAPRGIAILQTKDQAKSHLVWLSASCLLGVCGILKPENRESHLFLLASRNSCAELQCLSTWSFHLLWLIVMSLFKPV